MKVEDRNAILRDLARTHGGRLTPELVVEAASDPKHELHAEFDWDDEAAAHSYRLAIARGMIRGVRIDVRTETHTFKQVPVYTHDPNADGQGYINVEMASRENKRLILLVELERVISMITRAEKIAGLCLPGLQPDLEELRNATLSIAGKVKRETKRKPELREAMAAK